MFGKGQDNARSGSSTQAPPNAFYGVTTVDIVAPANTVAYVGELVSIPDGRGGWISDSEAVFVEGARWRRTLLPNADTEGSPAGFSWGYLGSGPTALARSILAHRLGEQNGSTRLSWLMQDDFQAERMSLPQRQPFRIEAADVDKWIAAWMVSPHAAERLDRASEERRWMAEHEEHVRAQARDRGDSEGGARSVPTIGHDLAEALRRGDVVAFTTYWRELSDRPGA